MLDQKNKGFDVLKLVITLLLCVWLDIIKKINFFAIVSFIKAEYYLFHLFFIYEHLILF